MEFYMQIQASLEGLKTAIQYITAHAESAKLSQKHIWRLQLAAEETIVNIIHHAYPHNSLGIIEISCHHNQHEAFSVTISDLGAPFDPTRLALQLNESHEPLNDGIGIKLIREIMDDVQYTRDANKNRLTLLCSLQQNRSVK